MMLSFLQLFQYPTGIVGAEGICGLGRLTNQIPNFDILSVKEKVKLPATKVPNVTCTVYTVT